MTDTVIEDYRPDIAPAMYQWHYDRAVKELARLDEKQNSPFHQHNEPYQTMLKRQRKMWTKERDEAAKRIKLKRWEAMG